MTVAIDPRATFEWIDKPDAALDDDDPGRTVWTLRGLTPQEEANVQDGVTMYGLGDDDGETKAGGFGNLALRALRLGLVDCRNFRDAKGDELLVDREKKGGREVVKDSFLAMIPSTTRTRMCNAITTYGKITDDDEGKP